MERKLSGVISKQNPRAVKTERSWSSAGLDMERLVLLLLLWSSAVPDQHCKTPKADVVFLIRSSSNVTTDQFETIKKFIESFATMVEISPNAVQIGVTQNMDTLFRLHQDKNALQRAVLQLHQRTENTTLEMDLKHVVNAQFLPAIEMRPDSAKILVLITTDTENEKLTYELLEPVKQLKDRGIALVVIAVGGNGNTPVKELVLGVGQVFPTDFESLSLFNLKEVICNINLSSSGQVRLVGGASRCAGVLEVNREGEWRPANLWDWILKDVTMFCGLLDCGSAVSLEGQQLGSGSSVWRIGARCYQEMTSLAECTSDDQSSSAFIVVCSDSVRLVNGSSRCSGRLEVRFNQPDQSDQSWSSVCEDDLDLQDQQVVCRELGCAAPSGLQGALYGEAQAPVRRRLFQCGGEEATLQDCGSSTPDRNTCSPAEAAGFTCTDGMQPLRLVGGASRCAGELQVNREEWRPVVGFGWSLKEVAVVCGLLDCGSAVFLDEHKKNSLEMVWRVNYDCFQRGGFLTECATAEFYSSVLYMVCSDSVRLVNGSSRCSGRLEVRFNQPDQSDQSWSSVCEDDLDLQDQQVVCRELGCAAPSGLQGALYGEAQAPVRRRLFQCGGEEATLQDCGSSTPDRNTCSPAEAAGFTCTDGVEPLRLVGGTSRCAGELQVNREEWRPVVGFGWSLKDVAVVCGLLDCGFAVSLEEHKKNSSVPMWRVNNDCFQRGGSLTECVTAEFHSYVLYMVCSDSVRLVNGSSRCSGRLEVRFNQPDQSDQSWSSVCEDDLDLQDQQVVCRELGCGAPSGLQGALYGEAQAPVRRRLFQCGGEEATLQDCGTSTPDKNTCSPAEAAGLTCTEPVLLVRGASHCAGELQVSVGREWRPVSGYFSILKDANVVCGLLDCGFAVSHEEHEENSSVPVWWVHSGCFERGGSLTECATAGYYRSVLSIVCSDLLLQPIISVSTSALGVSQPVQQGSAWVFRGSSFTISCSIQPQHPGGSFQLFFSSSSSPHFPTGTILNLTQTAVNHSANFLFAAAEPAHQGSYSCVYHLQVFSHNFSSVSAELTLGVNDPRVFLLRLVLMVLVLLSYTCAVRKRYQAAAAQTPRPSVERVSEHQL